MDTTERRAVAVRFGRQGAVLEVPPSAVVLQGQDVTPLPDVAGAVRASLHQPLGTQSLARLLQARAPKSVAIAVSDITRPVPNQEFLPAILEVIHAAGIPAKAVTFVIGTGMHRPSTPAEREQIVGPEVLARYAVVDHRADALETLVRIRETPPVRVCKRFAEAEFRIVTGYIEPHFMAGFSGGRKGVCPALVDLATVQRFHGYMTLNDPRAENGVLEGNPCHRIALEIARLVGVDFLFNVALTRDRRIAGVYAGELVQAHLAGCRQVAAWTSAVVAAPFDLVVTTGGGYPLDQTFYQTVKGMCGALPALGPQSSLLVLSDCAEGLGSESYSRLLLEYGKDWRRFLSEAAARAGDTRLDQWQLQMQCRVLQRIGSERLLVATAGVPEAVLGRLAVTPVPGPGDAVERVARVIREFSARDPAARIAVVPEGPYTLLVREASTVP